MLIAVMAGMAGQSYGLILDGVNARTSIRQMVTDIRYVQQMALGEGTNCYIAFDRYNGSYRIFKAANPGPHIIKVVNLEDRIRITGTTFPEDRFHFTALGAPSRGGTIIVCDGRGKEYRLTVLPATGRVKVYH